MSEQPYFENAEHALLAGMLWGLFMRQEIDAAPEGDDDGNYTDIIQITDGEWTWRVKVLP